MKTGFQTSEPLIWPRSKQTRKKLAARLEEELAGDRPPDLMLTSRQRRNFQSTVNDPQAPAALDGNWQGYRDYFFTHHMSGLSSSYNESMGPILDKLERFAKPRYISDITPSTIRRWFTDLRSQKLSDNTIVTYWRHVSAFLAIAVDDGILKKVPKVRLPKIDSDDLAKGRPLNLEEFERMRAQAKLHRPGQQTEFEFLLDGLWHSGLRISEAYNITWGPSDFYVDMNARHPEFVILKQKNKKRQRLPMVPDFADLLNGVPVGKRRGPIFYIPKTRGDGQISFGQTKKVISLFGEKALIRTGVNPRTGNPQTASAHDLRRSFGTRMAKEVMPAVLKELMRHKDLKTTMKYYAHLSTENIAEALYRGGQKGGQPEKSTVRD